MKKYCEECGNKAEPVGGKPPKFCSECGHSFGGVVKASTQVEKSTDNVSFASIGELELDSFYLDEEDSQVMKAENLLGTSQGGSKLSRRPVDQDKIRERMTSNKPLDV